MSQAQTTLDLTKISAMGEGLLTALSDLREQDQIVWHAPAQVWLVLRHADVAAGLLGDVPLSNKSIATRALVAIDPAEWESRIPRASKAVPNWLLSLDRPDHTKLRSLLNKGFKRSTIERIRPFVQQTIERVLAEAASRETVEFVEDIARPITGAVIMHLIGVPESYHHRMKSWADALVEAFVSARAGTPETMDGAEAAFAEMEQVFLTEITRRRAAPGDDFLSELVHASENGARLSETDLIEQLYMLLIAGHESTTNTVAMSVLALLRDETARVDFLARAISAETVLAPVLELMRFIAMAAAQPRVAERDFEWHGKQIKQGDLVFLMIASANRDPRVFSDPERIDFNRDNDPALTFAPGIHHCIGHLLAKLEVTEFLPRFLNRFPRARLLSQDTPYTAGLFFRGLETMQLDLGSSNPAHTH